MKTKKEVEKKASALFDSGMFCAESVLAAVAEYRGISSPLIPKIATGFCSGLSRTNSMCGAVTGGILALSMIYGRSTPSEKVEPAYEKVKQFLNEFEKQNGSLMCEGLIGCNLETDKGMKEFRKKGLRKKCSGFTGYAAGLVVELTAQ